VKKGIFLFSVIILLVAGWSAGWFYVTQKAETVIEQTKIKLADKGRDIECTNQNINGYPFRISLNCDQVRYADKITGLVFEAGELKSAAQAYQPNKAIVELKSPANLTVPNFGRFNATWGLMRSSMKAGLSGPENLSIQGTELKLIPAHDAKEAMLMKDMQLHGRQIGENDINIAISLNDAKSETDLWPSFDFNTALLLKDTYKDVINRASLQRVAQTKGLKGQIEQFQYAPKDGGMLAITGPVEIDRNGLLSGNFNVTVRNLEKLITALGESFPTEKRKFDEASKAVGLLAQQSGENEFTLPITVRNGSINIGFIPLGKLGPLF